MVDQRPTPTHDILVVQTEQERRQCYDIRIAVFHLEQKFPLDTEFDEFVLFPLTSSATSYLLRFSQHG